MAKLLIGCYSFESGSNYGTKSTTVVSWLRNAVEELEVQRTSFSAQLETGNAFQAIFVAPEYFFTDENTTHTREPMPKEVALDVVRDVKAISNDFKHILIFPGSIFYKEPLAVDINLHKFRANLISAELQMKKSGNTGVVLSSRATGGGTVIPSLKQVSEVAKKPNLDSYRAYNSVRAFLGGEVVTTPYLKQWDFKETEGASVDKLVYVPGSFKGVREIHEFQFGIEVCFDHANGALKGTNTDVDFHVVVSDWVETKQANMAMVRGGYFVHASSNPGQTGVYRRSPLGVISKLGTTAGALQANTMAYWLVDIDKRAAALPEAPTFNTQDFTSSKGKVVKGGVKVL